MFCDGGDQLPPRRQGFGELVGERRQQPAATPAGFVEVGRPERLVAEQGQEVAVDVWADGFHQVEREGVAAAGVGVDHGQGGVEADHLPQRFQLIHPWEPNPRRWLELDWTDHYSGHLFRIHTTGWPSPDSVKVKTNQDVLDRYHTHPEPKSLDPDSDPCRRLTHGLLGRRPVTATAITYIGKEANRLEDVAAGLIHDPTEILNTYSDPQLDPWRTLVIPTLREFNTAEIAKRSGLDRRTIQRHLNDTHYPRRAHRQTLTAIAADLAKANLQERSIEPPRAALAILRQHRDLSTRPVQTCAICGAPLDNPHQIYCGPRCTKRAYRARRYGTTEEWKSARTRLEE